MKKKTNFIIAISLATLTIVSSIFAMVPMSKINNKNNKNWLKNLDDNTSILKLSIPGSHDSGATHSIGDISGKCQDSSILEQLNMGVRFFDIRLQLRNNVLKVVHGFVDQDLDFSSVLKDFDSFLKENPSEGLFITIKEEASSSNSNITFEEGLIKAISNYEDIWEKDAVLPKTLKEIRGKIVLLSRYSHNTIGVDAYDGWIEQDEDDLTNTFNLKNSPIHVQDFYKIKNIEDKKQQVKDCFSYSSTNSDVLTLNFTSCYYLNTFPPTYAAISAKEVNTWLPEEINNRTNLGIVISDFVTTYLCSSIIERNFI